MPARGPVGQVARDFDLTETAVREWVRQAERDAGTRDDGGLTSAERKELAQLRAEDRRLREDVEILKRATAFFALRRAGELLPVHRGGESAAAQRQAGGRRNGGRRPPSPTPRPRPALMRSAGTSPRTPPGSTSAGAATSPTSSPGKAGSTY